jgi:hypothetical protein
MTRVDAIQGTADATFALGGLAGLMFLTTALWWLWDGLRLLRGKVAAPLHLPASPYTSLYLPISPYISPHLRGKVATSGERLVTRDEFDEDTASSAQLQPPAHWRKYKTPAGHDYYYDPATERIHYLSATVTLTLTLTLIITLTLTQR